MATHLSFFTILRKLILLFRGILFYPYYYFISRKTDCFHWQRLIKLYFSTGFYISMQTKYYGHYKILKHFALSHFNTIVEHGVYASDSDVTLKYDLLWQQSIFPINIVTFSKQRQDVIESYIVQKNRKNIKTFSVGPYIKYANNFLAPEKLAELKKELGKILLVYPLHSIEVATYQYNTEDFIKQIEAVKHDFDTVIISCYWYDLTKNAHLPYIHKNYKIACSGRREDPFFLNRQKDLMSLCDMVMSNGVGTHVGYAIAMDKPCYIPYLKSELIGKVNIVKETNQDEKYEQFRSIAQAFRNYSFEITPEQRQLISFWWGE